MRRLIEHPSRFGKEMVAGQEANLVVTGASGRVGRMLRAVWRADPVPGLRLVWTSRGEDPRGEDRGGEGSGGRGGALRWDLLAGPVPEWPAGAVVLHLAGAVSGDGATLARNAAMVAPLLAACRRNRVAAVLFASSAAVYAPTATGAREEDPPSPTGAYGRAKLAAEEALAAGLSGSGTRLVRLRIGNIVGADALIGGAGASGPVVLDPVAGQAGGPLRSWIGPVTLARLLALLAVRAAAGWTGTGTDAETGAGRGRSRDALPDILNLASDPPHPMAALLDAARIPWAWGPPNPRVIPAATLSLARLRGLCDLPPLSAAALAGELAAVRGGMAP